MKLVGEVGNWKIVAHIAFKFYSVASEIFSTGSTPPFSGASAATVGWASPPQREEATLPCELARPS